MGAILHSGGDVHHGEDQGEITGHQIVIHHLRDPRVAATLSKLLIIEMADYICLLRSGQC